MKFIINKKIKSIIPSTKLYDLTIENLEINEILNFSIINIDQNTIPILKINNSNYLINNFNPNNYIEDFEMLLTESDLISLNLGTSSGESVQSVTGNFVNNIDPKNPVIFIPNASNSSSGLMNANDFKKLQNLNDKNFIDDSAATLGGIDTGSFYHTNGIVKINLGAF